MNHKFLINFIKMLLIPALCYLPQSHAWDSHYLITYSALHKKVSQERDVPAEKLEDFLTKEQEGLGKILSEVEAWSHQHIPQYKSLPVYLNWQNQKKDSSLVLRFTQAIRVNPLMKFPLFVQNPQDKSERTALPFEEIVTPELMDSPSLHIPYPPFGSVEPNELLSPLEIIATASDEPDLGMDINLWEDSPSWFGKIYGFGVQPFGSKTLSYSSQIPFHMGFYYETKLVDIFAPYLKQSYPDYRMHQYLGLSRFAFSTNHPYWGYRFLGWALHYAQDLAQPYHSSLSPNSSTLKLLAVDALKLMGFPSYEQNIIQLLTNKHNSLENYEYFYLKARFEEKDNSTLRALANSRLDKTYPDFSDSYLPLVIAKESHQLAQSLDKLISEVLPAGIVLNPDYIFYETGAFVNLYALSQDGKGFEILNKEIDKLLVNASVHSRKLVDYALK